MPTPTAHTPHTIPEPRKEGLPALLVKEHILAAVAAMGEVVGGVRVDDATETSHGLMVHLLHKLFKIYIIASHEHANHGSLQQDPHPQNPLSQ